MTPRSIRRAAERKAAKLAKKAERAAQANAGTPTATPAADAADPATSIPHLFDFTDEEDDGLAFTSESIKKAFSVGSTTEQNETEAPPATPKPVSEAQRAANQQNAKKSTGPRTTTGKARVSMNALKTGLTAQTIVLTAEQLPVYQSHLDRRFAKYRPGTDDEHLLVQTIADNEWRLAQIAPFEAAIYAIGLREFAVEFADEPNPAAREGLIRGRTFLHYRRDLASLSLQERRIRNHIDKDVAKLEALQKSRLEKRRFQIDHCLRLTREQGESFQLADCGFDFSTFEFRTFIEQTSTQFRFTERRPDFDVFLAAFRSQQKGAKAA